MNSIAIVSFLAAVATLTSAAPTGPAADAMKRSDPTVCAPNTGYFQSCSNGFRGCCKADACSNANKWCPDYKFSTYEPISKTDTSSTPSGSTNENGAYWVCTTNTFRGNCKTDPCSNWCPQYKYGTYEPISTPPVTTPPSGGKQWYVCASNGFRGECSVDACAKSWCPDYNYGTYDPISAPANPPATSSSTAGLYYVCASNGFRGTCKTDPCNQAWCPDYKFKTYDPVTVSKRYEDPSICAPGTGYFQDCGNGFRGCCKSDACGNVNKWCPDYKFGTYEPVSSAPGTSAAGTSEPAGCYPVKA